MERSVVFLPVFSNNISHQTKLINDQTSKPARAFMLLSTASIRYIRYYLMTTAAIHLVNSFIIARLDYCYSILIGLSRY